MIEVALYMVIGSLIALAIIMIGIEDEAFEAYSDKTLGIMLVFYAVTWPFWVGYLIIFVYQRIY